MGGSQYAPTMHVMVPDPWQGLINLGLFTYKELVRTAKFKFGIDQGCIITAWIAVQRGEHGNLLGTDCGVETR